MHASLMQACECGVRESVPVPEWPSAERVARRDWTHAEDREGQEAGCIVGEAGCESLWRVRDGQALFEDDVGREAVDDFRELMPVQGGNPRGSGTGHSRVGAQGGLQDHVSRVNSTASTRRARVQLGVDEPTCEASKQHRLPQLSLSLTQ